MKKVKIINLKKDNKTLNDSKLNEDNSLINVDISTKTVKNEQLHNSSSQDYIKLNNKIKTINFDFPGFFNKKFDLSLYKKSRDDSREKSKSPERIYKLNHKKGNGIPEDLIERLNYLNGIVNDAKFQKIYKRILKVKNFEQTSDYLVDYYKRHNELDGLLMIFYSICTKIKLYSNQTLEKLREYYKSQVENVFDDEEYFAEGRILKPGEVYCKGIAISPSDIINVFEYFLKKLEIKFKRVEGYCKLLEQKKDDKKKLILDKKLKNKSLNDFFKQSRSKSVENLNNISSDNYINHCWHLVFVRGEWYFIDAFFGSGGIIQDKQNNKSKMQKLSDKKQFNVFYFLTPPQYLIYTHRPKKDYMQFLEKTLSFSQFLSKSLIDYGDFYMGVFYNNVELLTHQYPLIEINKGETLEIKIRQKNCILEGELFYVNNLLNRAGDVKTSLDDEKTSFYIEPIFPGPGEYVLKISSRQVNSSDATFNYLFDYRIKVKAHKNYKYFEKYKILKNENNKMKEKSNDSSLLLLPKLNSSHAIIQPKIIQDYSKILPSKTNKIICYDNRDFHLIEPKTKILRKGIKFKFKIKIKDASNVILLDGNHWTNLKRVEEDIYEGNKEIETDNVSLCCLRNKHVYTEVIKFMIYKDRSILSKASFPDKNKNKKNHYKSLTKLKNTNNFFRKIN